MGKQKRNRPKDLFSTRLTEEMVEHIRNESYWERMPIKEVSLIAFEEYFTKRGYPKPRPKKYYKTKPTSD